MNYANACTIASNNYLALARVFAESYKERHPGAEVYVCIADLPDPSVPYGQMPFVPIFAAELGIPGFQSFAFRYDILELNTAVKPFLLAHLKQRFGLDRVFYFDPDILILDRLDHLHELLASHPAVLVPHITRGLDDALLPPERMILMAGVYNLGFLGLRLDGTTDSFLAWWQERLARFCVNDIHNGVFVDQSWMDLAPAFLDDVAIARDPIYNVAYWNLPERAIREVDGRLVCGGRPLGFYHFSGIDFSDLPAISRHQNRVSLATRPELRPLFERYRTLVEQAGHAQLKGLPYGYRTFSGSDVPVPAVARRLLQRVDPKGLRFDDPYDLCRQDSFFAWLAEPIEVPGGFLNRAALALWEQRDDLVRAFPDVCGADLPRYVAWLKVHREGERAGLHPILLAPVRTRAEADGRPRRSTFGPQLHPYATLSVERAGEVLARLDLTRPGAMTAWLNEPIPGTAAKRPVVTRLALLLYKIRDDVQRSYPDPLEVHQAQFADWFCRHAAVEFRLHPDLVAPVLRSLPWRTRLAVRLRREAAADEVSAAGASPAAEAEVPPLEPTAEPAPRDADLAPAPAATTSPGRSGSPGVNLAGYFGMDTGVAQIGRGSRAALEHAGIDVVAIALDQETQSRMIDGRLELALGAPHPVTLLHANADETPRALSMLPIAGTAGGFKIGYWFWELSHFPLALADRFAYLDEVWAPSRFCQRSFEAIATIPVRYVPPCVVAPVVPPADVVAARARFGLEPGRFVFLVAFDVLSVPERKNPLAAIAAARQLARRTARPFEVLLKVSRARHAPELLAQLEDAARGLPISIRTETVDRAGMDALVAACDASLSLHRSEGLGLIPIETMAFGKPVVATGYGGVTDFLDGETGYPIDYELVRLDRDHAPYPAGAVWAEPDVDQAAERMLEILERPDEAAARAECGRSRIHALYGLDAATRRFGAEIERVYATLRSGRTAVPLLRRG